jgi:hypothetical protein
MLEQPANTRLSITEFKSEFKFVLARPVIACVGALPHE